MGVTVPAALINKLSKSIKELLAKPKQLKITEKRTVTRAAKKVGIDMPVAELRAAYKALKKPTASEKAAGAGEFKLKKPNPKPISDPGNVAPKDRKKVARLKASQDLDDAGKPLKSGKEMMTKEQYLESNPLELDAGVGSGSDVVSRIKDGRAITRDQAKEFDEIAAKESSGFQIKKYGGKVKRNMGGKVKRNMGGKVYRRGGGQALRGFGKATYSNKMY